MQTRIISAGVGIPVVLIGIWSGLPGIAILAVVAGLFAGIELDQLMRPVPGIDPAANNGIDQYRRSRVGSIRIISLVMGPALMAVAGAWLLSEGRITGDQLPITLAIVFALALLLRGTATLGRSGKKADSDRKIGHWVYWVFAAYVGIVLAHAPVLVELAHGRELLLLAIITTFVIDSAALFVGVPFGRHQLAPKISPKKSWEGAIAGVIAGIFAAIFINAAADTHFSTVTAGVLGAALGVSAVLGDLYESWIKRRAGVKDSGTLVPGHGGMLDRLDSVIPNLAVVYWAAVWSVS